MARAGEEGDDGPAPPALRSLLHFVRLPGTALDVVHRVVDQDEAFRARVAEAADEEAVGRAGWLWLARPEGWSDELERLTGERRAAAEAAVEEREERSARRQLEGAEVARRRAEEEAARSRAEASEARVSLGEERRGRRAAEEEAKRVTASLADADAALAEQRRRAKSAEEQLQEVRAEAARLRGRARELEQQVKASAARAEPAPPPPGPEAPVAAAPAAPAAAPATTPVAPAPARPGEARPGEAPAGFPRDALAAAVGSAAEAAERLSAALAEASRLLAPAPPTPPPAPPSSRAAAAGDRPQRRRPTPLPPAVLDDSTEAADHLVRVTGMVVLVDGYNVAKLAWPSETLHEQRGRLVDALAELAARTGARPHVVFDGEGGHASPRPVSRPVHVSFSPADVEADEVLLQLVEQHPAEQPVVVASSDREVQEGARRRGANVLSSQQLLAVLRR